MNRADLDKKFNAKAMNGHVAASMDLKTIQRPFDMHSIHGESNSEFRYINATSKDGFYILFIIPTDWGLGPHVLTPNSKVIKFESGTGFPSERSWDAERGEIFITDISDNNFKGTFVCYESSDITKERPALKGGTFQIDFTSGK